MTNYRERLTANANDFDSIVSEILAENERLREDDKQLRIMLAVSYSGSLLYLDDGELQDSRILPYIDFVRDSPETIAKKFIERLKIELSETKWHLKT